MVMWLYGYKSLGEIYYSALFCGHKHCGNRDKMFLVCQVISQDHMTKGWSNIMGGSLSWQVTSLPTFVPIGTVVVEI